MCTGTEDSALLTGPYLEEWRCKWSQFSRRIPPGFVVPSPSSCVVASRQKDGRLSFQQEPDAAQLLLESTIRSAFYTSERHAVNRYTVPNATMGLPGQPANGGSRPRFYEFDDGVTRLVKWHPSPHGTKATYNEIIASRLGQLIGAPILRGVVTYVPNEIIPSDHRADGAKAGFHFGVMRMAGENFVPTQDYNDIANVSELPFAAVHMAWLAIGDQEGHNQYLQRLEVHRTGSPPTTTRRFRLIDMGQMFGDFNWTGGTLHGVHESYKLPEHLSQKITFQKLESAIAALKKVSEEAIKACFEDCPEEWGILPDDMKAGVTRVVAARDSIEAILKKGNPSMP